MSNYQLLLYKLDTFIRKYYLNQLVRGVLIFLSVVLAFYIAASILEYQIYFSSLSRKLILVTFIGLSSYLLVKNILVPLSNYLKLGKLISHEKAAIIIGNHFDSIKDKLLNILQLNHQNQNAYNRDLIEASINQKIENIKLVPFTSAININENKKYLNYLLPSFFILLAIIVIAPQILKESNQRLITPNTVYAKKAPFEFKLKNKQLKAIQFEDIEIQLAIEGKTIPNEVYIQQGQQRMKMEKQSPTSFSYRFSNIQNDFHFHFVAGEFTSNQHTVAIVKKPLIVNYATQLNYPDYTGKKDEILNNTGDVVIPAGTQVTWNFEGSNAEQIQLIINNQQFKAQEVAKNKFTISKRFSEDTRYTVVVANKDMPKGDSTHFTITTLPDNFPTLQCDQIIDSTQPNFILLSGAVGDDYGLTKLEFVVSISDEKSKTTTTKRKIIALQSKTISVFNYTFNLDDLKLQAGQRTTYYLEVWDNDGVIGPKSTKSQTYQYRKASVQELEQQEHHNNEDIKDELANAQSKANQLSNQIKELKQKILSKNNLTWEDKKNLEQLQKEQQALQQELKEIDKKYEENLENQKEFKKENEEILAKQEKLQELMKDVLNDELKDLMKQIEDILSKMQQKDAFENLDKMQMSNENLNKELDKMQELFKQLQLEQKAQETIDKLKNLAEEQKKLSEQTQQQTKTAQELQQLQEELNKKFDNIQENLKQLNQLNKENEDKLQLDDIKKQEQSIEQQMQESKEQLQQNQKQKAAPKQKKAAEEMEQMAENLENSLDEMQMDQNAEDIQLIRQLLENLVKLSYDQEQVIKELKQTDIQAPKYVQLMQRQADLKEDADMIADSLQELAKRQFQLQNFISDELYQLNREMKKSLDYLQERYKPQAAAAQQFVMTHTNNLALMLSESLDNLQQQQNQKKQQGNGNCNKPGGKGNKPSMKQLQQELGEQLKQLQQGQQPQQGKEGKKSMSKEFSEAAEKQALIREALRQMKEQMSQQEKEGLKVDDLLNKMEEVEKDLITKKVTQQTINRQKEIETRLLEYDKAKREQGEDDKKQSKSAQDLPQKLPAALEQYLQQKKASLELYKSVPPNLQPFYQNLVDQYFRLIQ